MNNLQQFNKDQVYELIEALMGKSSKTLNNSSFLQSRGIIHFQTKPFIFIKNTEKGRVSLKVYVRVIRNPKKKWLWMCIDCGLKFNYENEFQCKKHHRQAPQVKLEISGLKEKELYRKVYIYTDLDGNLLSLNNIFSIKSQIEKEITEGVFNIWRYLPRQKKKYLFENYAPLYLKELKRRSKLDYEDDEWCSIAHLNDVSYAFKNHISVFLNNFDIVTINNGVIMDFKNSLNCPKKKNTKQKVCGKTLVDGKCTCGWEGKKISEGIPKSNHQKRKYTGYLRTMFKWAKRRNDIIAIPEFDSVKLKRKQKEGVSIEVQEAIFKKIPDKHKLIFRWIREEGRRPGEAPALKCNDVDFKKQYYYEGKVIGQGIYRYTGSFDRGHYKPFPKVEDKKGDEFPISEEGKAILNLALKDRIFKGEEFVFINPNNGKVYSYIALLKIFTTAREKAGYPDVQMNTWGRHTKAQKLIEDGLSYEQVADILGDKNAETIRKSYVKQSAGLKAGIKKDSGKKRNAKIIHFPN